MPKGRNREELAYNVDTSLKKDYNDNGQPLSILRFNNLFKKVEFEYNVNDPKGNKL